MKNTIPSMEEHAKRWKLDAEEIEIVEAIENNPQTMRRLRKALKDYVAKKEESITLRVNKQDLSEFKNVAASAGLKYQTYLGALIHQVAKGKLKVKL